MILETAIHSDPGSLPLHLVEEINHRIVNEYTEAISTLCLAAAQIPAAEARVALIRAADRLRAHAQTHRALLPPAGGQVNLTEYVGEVCASLSKASLADRGVRLTVDADEIWEGSTRAWRIGLVIAELVRNAARHGLAGRDGEIAVRLTRRDAAIYCLVGDNGRRALDPRPGRGVGLVRALAAELGGTVDWRFGEGGCLAGLQVPVEGLRA